MQFAGGKLFDLAFYNNLATRDGSVVHEGDNQTGAGDGDDESLTVDLDKVHGPVDTIVLMVSSYQGHSLTWLNRGYCRVTDADGAELATIKISGGPDTTGLVLATLKRPRPAGRCGRSARASRSRAHAGLAKLTRTSLVERGATSLVEPGGALARRCRNL